MAEPGANFIVNRTEPVKFRSTYSGFVPGAVRIRTSFIYMKMELVKWNKSIMQVCCQVEKRGKKNFQVPRTESNP